MPTIIGPRKKIMLLGSSITQFSFSVEKQGWGAQLAHWYSRSADVLNRGCGGYNSRWLKMFLPHLVGSEKPDMVILFIGNNDASDEGEAQHVSLEEYHNNVVAMLDYLYSIKSNMIILLVTPTQVNQLLKPKRSNYARKLYADVIRDMGRNYQHHYQKSSSATSDEEHSAPRKRNLAVIDLWGHPDYPDSFITIEDLYDGMHLNKTGNKKLFEAIKQCINQQFPTMSPDNSWGNIVRSKRQREKNAAKESASNLLTESALEVDKGIRMQEEMKLPKPKRFRARSSSSYDEYNTSSYISDFPLDEQSKEILLLEDISTSNGTELISHSSTLQWTAPHWKDINHQAI